MLADANPIAKHRGESRRTGPWHKAYAAASATAPLSSTTIPRREPTERDGQIEILYCGIYHSDLPAVRNEWRSVIPTVYPIVHGHENVGRVTRVGANAAPLRLSHARGRCAESTLGTGGRRIVDCRATVEAVCAVDHRKHRRSSSSCQYHQGVREQHEVPGAGLDPHGGSLHALILMGDWCGSAPREPTPLTTPNL